VAAPPGFVRRHWLALSVSAVLLAGVAAWLAFGYFAVQTLWVDDEVDEAAPVFDSGADVDPDPAGGGKPSTTEGTEGAEEAPVVRTVATGSFIDRTHTASGTASVLTDGTEQRFLRFTDFTTENGPDVNVYLSTTAAGGDEDTFDDDFVDLGDLRGNVGDQNYEIPSGVDLTRYRTVVLWCVRFSVAFGAADLAEA